MKNILKLNVIKNQWTITKKQNIWAVSQIFSYLFVYFCKL